MTRMTVRLINSKENPVLKTIRLVATQARRAPEGVVLAEGVRVLEEAVRSGCAIDVAVVSELFGRSERETRLLAEWAASGVSVYRVTESLFKSITGVMSPQGALALVRISPPELRHVHLPPNPLIACVCEVQDPGNLGSLIRTSAAAGCAFLCTTPGTVSARNPKTVRASAGTYFRIPVVERVSPADLIDYAAEQRIRLFRTSAFGGTDFSLVDFTGGCGVVLGNEAQGITSEAWGSLPAVRIPMERGVESLNVAAAGAVLLFEAGRRREPDHPAGNERSPLQ